MSDLNKSSNEELNKIIADYNKQLKLVDIAEKRFNDLKSFKKLNKREKDELDFLASQLEQDIKDLREWEKHASDAERILQHRKSKGIMVETPSSSSPQASSSSEANLKKSRTTYIMLTKRWLSRTFSPVEINQIEKLINAATSKEKIVHIYEHYKDISDQALSSTQALTTEGIEQTENPLGDIAPIIQAFARSKLSENIRESKQHLVLPKPPKRVSRPPTEEPIGTQTSQTQTASPYGAFKFVDNKDNKILQPISPEKAEELAIKKKIVKNVVMLSPDRFRRKPYVVHSSSLD